MKLADARRIALALPESVEAPHHDFTSFRVGGRIFATAPPGGEALHVFVEADQRDRALALAPETLEPLRWGGKVVGLRVTLAHARPALVRELLSQAWARRAPRRLLPEKDPR
jgi:hypothetical protein